MKRGNKGHVGAEASNDHSVSDSRQSAKTYFKGIQQSVIELFRDEPLNLDEANAERCAKEIVRVLQRNQQRQSLSCDSI